LQDSPVRDSRQGERADMGLCVPKTSEPNSGSTRFG
jgi:hypothetical protein